MQRNSWSALKIVTQMALIGFATALILWAVAPKQYESTAVLRVLTLSDPFAIINPQLKNDIQMLNMIKKCDLYPAKDGNKTPAEVLAEFRRNLVLHTVTNVETGDALLRVGFSYSNPAVAQKITSELVARFVSLAVESAPETIADGTNFEILSAASLDRRPVSPGLTPIVIQGMLGGIVIGGLLNLSRPLSRAQQN